MGKSSKNNNQKSKTDNFQGSTTSGCVTKAKDKNKKTKIKKVMNKLAKDISNSDVDFQKLQSKLVSEKENEAAASTDKQPNTSRVSMEQHISHEKKIEETTEVLACLGK